MPKIYLRSPSNLGSFVMIDVLYGPGDADPEIRLQGEGIPPRAQWWTISLTAQGARELVEGLNRALQEIEETDEE